MNVFDLFAKISLDTTGYEKALSGAKGKFQGLADGIKGIASGFGDVITGFGKTAAVGVGAASAAMTALTKSTLSAVGEFEQLEGGARKIFNEMDFGKIAQDAKNAYKELNMSAAEYLESINLAGATFAQTMGDEKGYDTARKGMLAIADFASGTGKNLTELNQKYQLITRSASGYQSIADQFAGVLPQTSADFLEAAQNAGLLSKSYGELKDVPIAEYQQAVTEMIVKGVEQLGLSNNTLRESTETLTGSFAMAKAAWKNFMVGTSDVKTFKDAFTSAIDNTIQNLDEIVPRLSDGLIQLSDALAPEIPRIIENTLPSIIDSSSALITGLAERLPDPLTAILPSLASGVINVTTALVTTSPQLIKPLGNAVKVIGDELIKNKDQLLKAGGELLDMVVTPLTENSAKIGETAVVFISNLAKKIADAKVLENIGAVAGDIINGLEEGLSSEAALDAFFDAAPKFLTGLANGIVNFLVGENNEGGLLGAVEGIINNIAKWFENDKNRDDFWKAADNFIDSLGEGLLRVLDAAPDILLAAGRALLDIFIGNIDYDHGADEFWSSLLTSIWNSTKRWELPFGGEKEHIAEMYAKHGGSLTYPEFEKKWYEAEDFGDWLFGMSDSERLQKMGISGSKDYRTEHLAELQAREARINAENIARRNRLWEQIKDNAYYTDRFQKYTETVTDAGKQADYIEGLLSNMAQDKERSKYVSNYGIPAYGDGAIVSKPTLAWIGERGEKEAVVPLEHETEISRALGLGGGVTIQFGDIYVSGMDGNAGDEVVRQIDEALRLWQLSQKRGVGSAAWQ